MTTGRRFWPTSGMYELGRNARGHLVPTDAYWHRWLGRPELELVPDSCEQERRLHAAFAANPRVPITPVTLLRIRDPDARENWRVFAAFRDHLLAHATVEDAYLTLFLEAEVPLAAPFVDHLAHLIVHAMLADCVDALRLRAAELLFRPQRSSIVDGNVLLADQETVERLAATGGFGDLGRLVREAAGSLRSPELEVLGEENAGAWFARSERFDFALDLTFGRPGLDALCRVLEAWVARFFAIDVSVQPLAQVRDERWRWHIGLDNESSAILNDLYRGQEVDETRLARLLALFRMEFRDPSVVVAELRGYPVYLGLATDASGRVRLKPQNLLVNLPLARAA